MSGNVVIGRAVYEIVTDQTQFNQGLAQAKATADRESQQISASLDRSGRSLAGPGLQQGAAEFDRTLTKMAAEAEATGSRAGAGFSKGFSQFTSSSGGGAGGFFGSLLTEGAEFAAGFAAVGLAISGTTALLGGLKSGVIDYNASIDQVRAQLLAFTKDQGTANAILQQTIDEANRTPFTFQEMARAEAGLIPVSRQTNEALQGLVTTAEILAASHPEQGLQGAAFALREAASGDFTSISDRFDLPRQRLLQLRNQGVPAIEAVRQVMQEMGYDIDLVNNLSNTFSARTSTATDNLQNLAAIAGKPIFDNLNHELDEFNSRIGANGARQAAQDFADALAKMGYAAATFSNDVQKLGLEALQLVGEAQRALLEAAAKLPGAAGDAARAYLQATQGVLDDTQHKIDDIDAKQKALDQQQKERDNRQPATGGDLGLTDKEAAFRNDPQTIAAIQASGQEAMNAYIQGFSQADFTALDSLMSTLESRLKAGLNGQLNTAGAQELLAAEPLLARAISDVNATGSVQADTLQQIQALLGANADEVLTLVDAYGRLSGAQAKVSELQNAYTMAQTVLKVAQEQDQAAIDTAQQGVDAAQATAQQHQRETQAQTQALQNRLTDLNAEADQVARGYQTTLDGLNRELATMQRDAQAAEAALAQQVEAAQSALDQAQSAAQQHANAYQAVLDGTTDIFRAQNDQLDEQTQKILANGEAQIGVQRRLKDAENERVSALTRQQDRGLLAIDEQIAQTRESSDPNRTRQLAALQKQRQDYLAATQPNIDLERERAKVAQDDFDQRAKAIQKQATDQETADKKATDAAQTQLNAVQARAKAQQEADQAAAQALQDQIAKVQDEAKQSAAMYDERKRGVQAEITEVQRRAQITATADQKAIDDATTHLNLVKETAKEDIAAHQKVADNAKNALDFATQNVGQIKDQITQLQGVNSELDKRNEKELAYLNMLRAERGLPPLTSLPATEAPPALYEPAAPVTPPPPLTPNPAQPEGPGGAPSAPPAPPPQPLPAQVVDVNKIAPPPPGYHTESDGHGNFWYIPDGHRITEYGPLGTPTAPAPGTSGPTAAARPLDLTDIPVPAGPMIATMPSLAERGLLSTQPAAVAPRGGDLIINNPIVADVVGLAQFRREVQAALDQHTQQQGVVLRNVLGAGSGAGSLLG